MKIAAVGNEGSRKALASKKFKPGTEWVWVESVDVLEQHRDAVLFADLDFIPDKARIDLLSRLLPTPVLIHSMISTLSEIDRPFIRINGWPGLLERPVCELAVRNRSNEADVDRLFDDLGWPCRFAPDIPGMITGRILAAIINEAWFTLQDGVSTKEEIDEAMRLGTHYPAGPFEWGRRIGWEAVHDLLAFLSRTDARYCPAGVFSEELRKVKI
jgi:3-hydroxybutyryl-CoA dehydrogenase